MREDCKYTFRATRLAASRVDDGLPLKLATQSLSESQTQKGRLLNLAKSLIKELQSCCQKVYKLLADQF